LVFYVHGGLVSGVDGFRSAAGRSCDFFSPVPCGLNEESFEALNGFPLFVVWHSGFAEAVGATMFASRTREASPHGVLTRKFTLADHARDMSEQGVSHNDALLDGYRVNDAEVLFRNDNFFNAPNLWRFMQGEIDDAFSSREDRIGFRLVRDLARMHADFPGKLHVVLVGHSMGTEFTARFVEEYDAFARGARDGRIAAAERANPLRFDMISLAPAVSYAAFERALRTDRIARLRLFMMDDRRERLNPLLDFAFSRKQAADIYPLSLLYFVSGVLNPYPDYPLLGMHRYWVDAHGAYASHLLIEAVKRRLFTYPRVLVLSPSTKGPEGMRSCAERHGDFEGDDEVVASIIHIVNHEWNTPPPAAGQMGALFPQPAAADEQGC
jgi:pimeloyl-ACP methyl ester carboxylesterase